VSLGSEFFGKSTLRDEFKFDFTTQVLLLKFRVLTNIRSNKLFHLVALQKRTKSISGDTYIFVNKTMIIKK